MKVAIITDVGNQQANMLLCGVYGTIDHGSSSFMSLIMGPFRQEPTVRNFNLAPEFKNVSYLFTLLEDGSAPVNVNEAIEVTLPDRMGPTLKTTMMDQLGDRWTQLYDAVAPAGTAEMLKVMLNSEKARMRRGVADYIESQGMKRFVVGVSVKGSSRCAGDVYDTKQELVADMAPDQGAAFAVTAVRDADRQRAEVPRENDQASAWAFPGRCAEGTMHFDLSVCAPNPELAGEFAQFILNDKSMREDGLSRFLTVKLDRVENLREGALEDAADAPYNDRERDY